MQKLDYYLKQVEEIMSGENFMGSPNTLYEPIDYTLRLGGKRIRPTLLLVANAMFGGKEDEVKDAALGIETFHNFTLLHDDLMDKSPLRRGKPTVYSKWDENHAILSGDTMYALAWRYFLRQPTKNLQAILQCFAELAIEVCEGQQYDMDFEKQEDVSMEQYLKMIRLKTGVLLAGALKIGALYADAPIEEVEAIYQYGLHIGLAFQIQDDLLDGYGDVAVFGKKVGQDIRDNKKTFLPLYAKKIAVESGRNDLKEGIDRLFGEKKCDDEEKKIQATLSIYEQLGLKEKVKAYIEDEFVKADAILDSIGVAEERKLPLREIENSIKERKK